MPLRRSQVLALDVIAYTGDQVRLGLHVGSGTYVRSIAEALGGHCVTLRRTAVGPFAVEEADPARLVSVADALGRLPAEALDRCRTGSGRRCSRSRPRPPGRQSCQPSRRGRTHREGRPRAGRARAQGRGRSRSAPSTASTVGHQAVVGQAIERRPDADGRHLPPAPPGRARLRRRARSRRSSAGWSCSRRSGSRRRSWSSSRPRWRRLTPEDVRPVARARAGRGGRRGGRGVPLRRRRGRRPRRVRAARRRDARQRRSSPAFRRRRIRELVVDQATSAAPPRCSAGRSRSRGSSSRATPAAARWASRPRTSGSTTRCSCRAFGIYAGSALGHRAAVSIGVNPHYGGSERRVEAFLLDFEGDLYGRARRRRALGPAPRRGGVRERGRR